MYSRTSNRVFQIAAPVKGSGTGTVCLFMISTGQTFAEQNQREPNWCYEVNCYRIWTLVTQECKSASYCTATSLDQWEMTPFDTQAVLNQGPRNYILAKWIFIPSKINSRPKYPSFLAIQIILLVIFLNFVSIFSLYQKNPLGIF